jgi:RHS repeat-associated protein
VAANPDGSLLSRQGYLPWGELRYTEGSLPGRYQFTGQASYEAEFGLYYYKARWYDPHLGRFSQPDSIVPDPGNPLDWDRYQYARANPLKYTDPTGHFPWLLIPIFIFIATIPGDTGPYEVDPVTSAVGDAALRFVDPIDAVFTGVECLQGQCSGVDILFAILPVVNGGLDDAADAARIAAKEAGIVETTGQIHHVFSQKIMTELNKHDTLKGVFERNDLLVQALDKASHNGYQTWHREYDDQVVEWLKEHDQATIEEFLSFLQGLYSQTDLQQKFPDADQLIQMTIEEIK